MAAQKLYGVRWQDGGQAGQRAAVVSAGRNVGSGALTDLFKLL